MTENYSKNDYFEIWLENGIINYKYAPNLKVTLPVAKLIVSERIRLFGEVYRPSLTDARKFNSIDKEAREYLTNEEGVKYVSAGAILINNQIQKLLANALLKINKPKLPAKIFTNKEEAVKWLEYFKSLN